MPSHDKRRLRKVLEPDLKSINWSSATFPLATLVLCLTYHWPPVLCGSSFTSLAADQLLASCASLVFSDQQFFVPATNHQLIDHLNPPSFPLLCLLPTNCWPPAPLGFLWFFDEQSKDWFTTASLSSFCLHLLQIVSWLSAFCPSWLLFKFIWQLINQKLPAAPPHFACIF